MEQTLGGLLAVVVVIAGSVLLVGALQPTTGGNVVAFPDVNVRETSEARACSTFCADFPKLNVAAWNGLTDGEAGELVFPFPRSREKVKVKLSHHPDKHALSTITPAQIYDALRNGRGTAYYSHRTGSYLIVIEFADGCAGFVFYMDDGVGLLRTCFGGSAAARPPKYGPGDSCTYWANVVISGGFKPVAMVEQ